MSPACSPVCPGSSRTILCLLLLSGLCSCLLQYHLIDEPKTWREAQTYRREKYIDLASIGDMEDTEWLIAAAGSGYEGEAWIGLYDKRYSWTWTLIDRDIYGHNERDFRRWQSGEPENMRRRGVLCTVFINGFWYDESCNRMRTFVCYNKTTTLESETPSIKRHFYIDQHMAWYTSRYYCRKHYTDLTSVRNENENTIIQGIVPHDSIVLIGLHRLTWSWWSDDKNHHSPFENWADGHPKSVTDNCAAVVLNATQLGKWMANHCSKKLHFVCTGNKKHMFKVKLTVLKSTIDLNKPAVTDAILNQVIVITTLVVTESLPNSIVGIKKNLNEETKSKFKISWVKKPGKDIFHKEKKNTDAVK